MKDRSLFCQFAAVVAVSLLLLVLTVACGNLEVGIEGTIAPDHHATATMSALVAENAKLATEVAALAITPIPPSSPTDTADSTAGSGMQGGATTDASPTPDAADSIPLHVAFLKDSGIWLWVDGQGARSLTTIDSAGDLKISDDGAMVAFVKSDGSLWVTRSDGSGAYPLVSAEDFEAMEPRNPGVILYRFDWVPRTHTLAFNTQLRTEIGLLLNDDLHLVDADTMEQVVLLPAGLGGEFYYSPDGQQIAITTATAISLVDADGENLREVLTFPPVVTYSEFQFYPRPVWAADGGSLRVAIPPADPQAELSALTGLWYISTDGTPTRLMGNIMAMANSRPVFSPDLSHILHLAGQGSLLVTNLETGQTEPHQSGVDDILGWAPDSRHFAVLTFPGTEPQAQIGGLYAPSIPAYSDTSAAAIDLTWVGDYAYLFLSNGPTGWEIRLGEIGGASTQLAFGISGPSPYDMTGTFAQMTPVISSSSAPTQTPVPMEANPALQSLGIASGRAMGLSADGRYIVFESTSTDLVDQPMAPDIPRIFLHDRELDDVVLVSATPGGAPADFWSMDAVISADGSTVAFWSFAGNMAGEGVQDCPGTGPGEPCGSLYLYDVPTGKLERVPVGAGYGLGMATETAISADGRLVGFATEGGAIWDGTLLLDRSTGEISQISTSGLAVALSADGRFVAYVSDESDLVAGDTNETYDVFVLDRSSGAVERIGPPPGEGSGQPSGVSFFHEGVEPDIDISADGRYVVFISSALGFVPTELTPCTLYTGQELPACRHVYLRDREMGTTEFISQSSQGSPGNDISSGGSVSADGRWVAFTSVASNLAPEGPVPCEGFGPVNCGQVLLRDRQFGLTYLVSVAGQDQLPNGGSFGEVMTADGRYVVFNSGADNLVPGVDGGLFMADLPMLVGQD